MAFVSQKVMEEGLAAKRAGRSDEANPYPAGSQNSADWLEGYTADEPEQNIDPVESDG
ncbi:ribosome modulation factor [Methylobacterium gossipiicola]|uniref:Ribosome modulation factor n=1 Tax=Methylobacterium gossipiicola TaxID=582675 RepID=A0A1I2VJF9_9HYPH|nr:hypothetical protein [Methylobacterium gossipiicola]SFG89260.1 hypothetical protein SAMN05192565_11575 [Methylobacterium gossipiicola]